MPNQIKDSADGLALQVTREARSAGLVEEDTDGEPTDLADVLVWAFDDLLIVIDRSVAVEHRAELVATAASDTGSIHSGSPATVAIAGNGYQVQLPGCKAAGFTIGDTAPVRSSDGVLFVHDGTNGRLIGDLIAIRQEQISG
jgi:hypothetical protein